jgi:hypothetical protein
VGNHVVDQRDVGDAQVALELGVDQRPAEVRHVHDPAAHGAGDAEGGLVDALAFCWPRNSRAMSTNDGRPAFLKTCWRTRVAPSSWKTAGACSFADVACEDHVLRPGLPPPLAGRFNSVTARDHNASAC